MDDDRSPAIDRAIFAGEQAEIRRRRDLLGRPPLPTDAPAAEMRLTGLALSGGGIRSACVSLGVVQAFARARRLAGFDYLSTVSGGGYLGAAVSSILGTRDETEAPAPADAAAQLGPEFPFRLGEGAPEPSATMHLRSHSSFLTPDSVLGQFRLAAVLVRGVFLNLFLFLPTVLAAVVLTRIMFEVGARTRMPDIWVLVPLLLVGVCLMAFLTFPFVARVMRGRSNWQQRNRYERTLSVIFAAAILGVLLIPLDAMTHTAVTTPWPTISAGLGRAFDVARSPLVWGIVLASVLLWSRLQSAVPALSAVGAFIGRLAMRAVPPVVLLGLYFLLCARFVHLPYVSVTLPANAAAGVLDSLDARLLPASLRGLVDEHLTVHGAVLSPRARIDRVVGSTHYMIRDSTRFVTLDPRRTLQQDELLLAKGGLHEDSLPISVEPESDARVRFMVTLRRYPEPEDFGVFAVLLLVVLINAMVVDVNLTSLHGFYRDRLSRAFLLRQRQGRIAANDRQTLSGLNATGVAPYHLINATLNVSGSRNPLARGRSADFFLFSKLFTGSACTGYCRTEDFERADPRVDLAGAVAISGAAAGPRMGVATLGWLSGQLAMLDLRLSYWARNPRHIAARKKHRSGGPGPGYLVREAIGMLDERGPFVNISDGGHIENLGVYELLRRRCSLIVAVDAESDPAVGCTAMATLIRYARIDLGVDVRIDLAALRTRTAHWALGEIWYDAEGRHVGKLVYLKSSVTGDETEDVLAFGRRFPEFPHHSTADQFFDEAHFEGYRALGDHIAKMAFADNGPVGRALRELDPPVIAPDAPLAYVVRGQVLALPT